MTVNANSTEGGIDTTTAIKLGLYTIIMVGGVMGNILVFVAVANFQSLKTVSNTFVLSLASADLTVSGLILPLSIQEAYYKRWYLGEVLCRFWIAGDVLFVTISIFNLAAISVDRYRSIKDPLKYSLKRTNRMAYKHIAAVWLLSLFVGVPPFYFAQYIDGVCYLEQNPYFIVPATTIGFFLPLAVVLFAHLRVFKVARTHAKRVGQAPGTASEHTGSDSIRKQPYVSKNHPTLSMPISGPGMNTTRYNEQESAVAGPSSSAPEFCQPISNKISVSRERKAARTVAIVLGVFTVCWMPFFVAMTASSLCKGCDPNLFPLQVLTWLGYANSAANPIIYTIFNKDFRQAFGKILQCRLR